MKQSISVKILTCFMHFVSQISESRLIRCSVIWTKVKCNDWTEGCH